MDATAMTSSAVMPALFIGHGNPMNAIVDNAYSRAWKALATELPRPKVVLCISAHWYEPGGRVTANAQPRTIHDFGGFPRELHEVQYPAPGSLELAQRVAELLAPERIELDKRWGLDHGTWSVLVRMYPDAGVPVVQLGLDDTLTAREHFDRALKLKALRREGVLVLGSGNVVHNLHAYGWGRHVPDPYDWGQRFEKTVRHAIDVGDAQEVVDYELLGRDAQLSAPTPDHFLPLLYVLAQREPGDAVSYPIEGFDGGSVSMLSVRIG